MKTNYKVITTTAACLLMLQSGAPSWGASAFEQLSGRSWNPGFSSTFGKRGPEYDVRPPPSPREKDNNFYEPSTPTGPSTPIGPSPAELQAQQRQNEARDYNKKGIEYWSKEQWQLAVYAFQAAVDKWPDNKTFRDNLTQALTALAYEKHLKETKERKGRALVEMEDCLIALSKALAEIKSSVACNKMARSLQSGLEPGFSEQAVMVDASVVDLRHVEVGVVAMEKLRSPYTEPPQPVFVKGPNRLSEEQMAKLGSLWFYYEMGIGPSEQDIVELLGLPSIDHKGPTTGFDLTVRKQTHAAIERFSSRLMKGCNEALFQTSKELNEDPVTQKVKAIAVLKGADRVDPPIKRLWEQRNKEAQQRLFTRFIIVQEMAIRDLGIECSLIFKLASEQAPGTPARGR